MNPYSETYLSCEDASLFELSDRHKTAIAILKRVDVQEFKETTNKALATVVERDLVLYQLCFEE